MAAKPTNSKQRNTPRPDTDVFAIAGAAARRGAPKAKGLPEEALPLSCLEAAAQRSPTPTLEAVLMRTAIRGL